MMYRLTKLVLGAILGVSLMASYAFAVGKGCGPAARSCVLHHENCTCKGFGNKHF
jgi:hypothetical protein